MTPATAVWAHSGPHQSARPVSVSSFLNRRGARVVPQLRWPAKPVSLHPSLRPPLPHSYSRSRQYASTAGASCASDESAAYASCRSASRPRTTAPPRCQTDRATVSTPITQKPTPTARHTQTGICDSK